MTSTFNTLYSVSVAVLLLGGTAMVAAGDWNGGFNWALVSIGAILQFAAVIANYFFLRVYVSKVLNQQESNLQKLKFVRKNDNKNSDGMKAISNQEMYIRAVLPGATSLLFLLFIFGVDMITLAIVPAYYLSAVLLSVVLVTSLYWLVDEGYDHIRMLRQAQRAVVSVSTGGQYSNGDFDML